MAEAAAITQASLGCTASAHVTAPTSLMSSAPVYSGCSAMDLSEPSSPMSPADAAYRSCGSAVGMDAPMLAPGPPAVTRQKAAVVLR